MPSSAEISPRPGRKPASCVRCRIRPASRRAACHTCAPCAMQAERAEKAADLEQAAAATASMLAACGDCHRAVGTMPAHPTPPEPKIGGVLGHMEEHKVAADLMAQGLTTPSSSLWMDRCGSAAQRRRCTGAICQTPRRSLRRRAPGRGEHSCASQRAHEPRATRPGECGSTRSSSCRAARATRPTAGQDQRRRSSEAGRAHGRGR